MIDFHPEFLVKAKKDFIDSIEHRMFGKPKPSRPTDLIDIDVTKPPEVQSMYPWDAIRYAVTAARIMNRRDNPLNLLGSDSAMQVGLE